MRTLHSFPHFPFLSRAIYESAAEICNKPIDPSEYSHFQTIAVWTSCDPMISGDSETDILISLLCYAIGEECSQRSEYVGRIMQLDGGVQRTLMQLIKEFNDQKNASPDKSFAHPDESYLDDLNLDDDDNVSLLDDDYELDKENVGITSRDPFIVPKDIGIERTPLSPFRSPTPSKVNTMSNRLPPSSAKKLLSPPPYQASGRNVSARKVIKLEKETQALSQQNQELQRELEAIREQERLARERCERMEEKEAFNKAARMQLESDSIRTKEEYTLKIEELEQHLKHAKQSSQEAAKAKEQLASLQDEVDILKHSKIKLHQTESQLQKLKEKVESMGDVNKALEAEEKAHSEALSKCLDLENQVSTLLPLKKRLEEYKVKATEAEAKLADSEDEIRKLREASMNVNGLNDELQRGFLRHQEENEELRRALKEKSSDNQSGLALGGGMSELNPKLKEELLRLRNENSRLKEFAAKREDDNVLRLEEDCDDAKRLAENFKEKFLATKRSLESTQRDLAASLQRERKLENQVRELESSVEDLETKLQDERVAGQKAKLEATKTLHATKKELTDQAKIEKERLTSEWEEKLSTQKSKSAQEIETMSSEFNSTVDELNQRIDMLRAQSIESLQKMEKDFEERTTAMKESHLNELETAKSTSDEERKKLIEHGKQLIQKTKVEAERKIQDLQDELDEVTGKYDDLLEGQKIYETKAVTKIQTYKQRLNLAQAQVEETSRECDEYQMKLKRVEREKATIQSENDRMRRQLGGRFGTDNGEYEELQRNFNDLLEENRALKKKTTSSPESIDDPFNMSRPFTHGQTSVSASSLSQLRSEYEEKIDEILDEKRELVMKNTSLVTESKLASKRVFELQLEIKKIENLNTSLKLQLAQQDKHKETLFSPVTTGKRSTSKRTPSLVSKASKMWKGSKSSSKSSPDSDPMIDLKSPEATITSGKKDKSDIEGFKTKLMHRLSAKKKKSPIKEVSLLEMAQNNMSFGVEEGVEISFSEGMTDTIHE